MERPLEGVQVLVAEDDEDSRNLLRQMVEWFGARVHTARDGEEALAWLEKHVPDLLLLDLRMPRVDGFAVFRHVRGDPRFSKVRAIAVTALGSDDDVMQTWEAGFDGHLVKPIDFETLALALNRAFWAHSGEVRFSVWKTPAAATPSPHAGQPSPVPVHIADIVARQGAPAGGDRPDRPAARPAPARRPASGPERGLQLVRGGRAVADPGARPNMGRRRGRSLRD